MLLAGYIYDVLLVIIYRRGFPGEMQSVFIYVLEAFFLEMQ